jgi:hypothetical protein
MRAILNFATNSQQLSRDETQHGSHKGLLLALERDETKSARDCKILSKGSRLQRRFQVTTACVSVMISQYFTRRICALLLSGFQSNRRNILNKSEYLTIPLE